MRHSTQHRVNFNYQNHHQNICFDINMIVRLIVYIYRIANYQLTVYSPPDPQTHKF